MTRRNPVTEGLLSLLAICLILIVGGCGTDGPVAAPGPGANDGPGPQVTVRPGGGEPAPRLPGDAREVGVPAGILSVSVPVDGAVGGTVALGHFTVEFPPGAFQGTQTITMVCENAAGLECELYPDGLQFSRPVRLTMHLRGQPIDEPGATIYWWNPASGTWVDLMGVYSRKGHTVSASLYHFCLFRGGRAGW